MTGTGTILLVRHGETEWNRTGRIQGWATVGVNERGREQARAVGEYLGDRYDVDRVVASDLRRTRETAREIRPRLELGGEAVDFEAGWRERDFGVFQGMAYEAVYGRHPEFSVARTGVLALESTPEGGESLLAARERVLSAWEALLGDLEGTVAVVTHGGPIHVVRAALDGRDMVAEITGPGTTNGAVDAVAVEEGRATPVERDVLPPGAPESGAADRPAR